MVPVTGGKGRKEGKLTHLKPSLARVRILRSHLCSNSELRARLQGGSHIRLVIMVIAHVY